MSNAKFGLIKSLTARLLHSILEKEENTSSLRLQPRIVHPSSPQEHPPMSQPFSFTSTSSRYHLPPIHLRQNYSAYIPTVAMSQASKRIFLNKYHTRNNHVANVPTCLTASTRLTPCSTIEISENNLISQPSQMSQSNKHDAQLATH